MNSVAIRKRFLDFFSGRGHAIIKSDSLIPKNDPTLLFTGAGMNQFKENFLGIKKNLNRATSSQKCIRTGDLDVVGTTPYHHSFFEMLGNFSFNDYFKREAIQFAWDFLTCEMKLAKERLFVSVHNEDEEAFEIWTKEIKIPETRIARLGDDSNFWPASVRTLGPNGPCGPCSEIFFDQGDQLYPNSRKHWSQDTSGRFGEIWNLVFTQFNREENGMLSPLGSKNIDTGMGLERLACFVQGKRTNFETDLFEPLIAHLKKQMPDSPSPETLKTVCAIADHARAVVIGISDGAHPTNEGRGYVIRKLIRRAIWKGRTCNMTMPILTPLISTVIQTLSDAYPELNQTEQSVREILNREEQKFSETLDIGLKLLSELTVQALKRKDKTLSGEDVFRLYDTFGFPDELTRTVTHEKGISIDEKGFQSLLEEQRKRAQGASRIDNQIFVVQKESLALPPGLASTKFVGYEKLESKAQIIWLNQDKNQVTIALDQTPFYPEGGGQVGDVGVLRSDDFEMTVCDTQKKDGIILHHGTLVQGNLKSGLSVTAIVNKENRAATKRNHTATHLLQAALRSILGTHVRQVGSLVNAEKLRFDYTHGKSLTDSEIQTIETWINQTVLDGINVQSREESYEAALQSGALAFFGDKYGDSVRTIHIPEKSKELCGGTHCHSTAEIGSFKIVSEASIGSGTRRIEAVTGLGLIERFRNAQKIIQDASSALKTTPDELAIQIQKLTDRLRELERKCENTTGTQKKLPDLEQLLQTAEKIGAIQLIAVTLNDYELQNLRVLSDQFLKQANKSMLVFFSPSSEDEKVNFVIAVTGDLIHLPGMNAKKLAQEIARCIEGSGGGREDFAQGGGRNSKGIPQAIEKLREIIKNSSEKKVCN